MKARKATSVDIAYMAGVSQSTVSRALRNSPLVNPETRAKVHEIAKQLNYKVDKNAASLRTQQSQTLALLLFEDRATDDSMINPFFLSMLGNITRAAANAGYDLLVSFQQLSEDWHSEYEVASRADGLILLGYGDYITYQPKLEVLAQEGAHFIIWGPIVQGQPGHSLGCDNYLGGTIAANHLIELGRRKPVFIGDASEHCPEFLLRYEGFCDTLKKAGIDPPAPQFALNEEQAGYQAMQGLLESKVDFDSLFTASDLMAIGAMKALKQKGINVPEQISVIGFDDIMASQYVNPALTTVHQDTQRSGEILVQNLIALIRGEEVDSQLIRPSLVVRDSCGAKRYSNG